VKPLPPDYNDVFTHMRSTLSPCNCEPSNSLSELYYRNFRNQQQKFTNFTSSFTFIGENPLCRCPQKFVFCNWSNIALTKDQRRTLFPGGGGGSRCGCLFQKTLLQTIRPKRSEPLRCMRDVHDLLSVSGINCHLDIFFFLVYGSVLIYEFVKQ
jgi:hypothetical protein